jgi:hypothetical protein
MSLAAAILEARHLAAQDPLNFYRVVPADEKMREFHIQKVSKQSEWARRKTRGSERASCDYAPYSYSFRYR